MIVVMLPRTLSRSRHLNARLACGFLTAILLFSVAGSRCARGDVNAAERRTQNPLKQLTLEQLGNVEVTGATKERTEVRKTSAAVYVITQEDIQRSGATSIPEALRLAPGVEVARIDSNKWSIRIRGFGSRLSRDVLVLIDGRTVYTTLLAGTYWEVQNLMLQDVDHIEVVRGPGATIWGPNALNGVINIITRNSKDTQGTLVTTGGGTVNEGFVNARYGGSSGANFNYRVYAFAFDRGPEYHPDHDNYDSWRAVQSGFRMDFASNARNYFTVQGDAYDEGAGETVTATSYTPPYSQTVRGTELLSGWNVLGRWRRTDGPGQDMQAQAYFNRTARREPNPTTRSRFARTSFARCRRRPRSSAPTACPQSCSLIRKRPTARFRLSTIPRILLQRAYLLSMAESWPSTRASLPKRWRRFHNFLPGKLSGIGLEVGASS